MHPPQQRPPPPRVHVEAVTQCGWTVTARKAPIIGSPLLEEYSDQLGGVLTLPEILFGNSSLQLRHDATGVTLYFTALQALQQWKRDNLPPLKVALAKEWQAARQQEIENQQAVVLDYDWTYSTSYAGSISVEPAVSSSTPAAAPDSQNPADQPSKSTAADGAAGSKQVAGDATVAPAGQAPPPPAAAAAAEADGTSQPIDQHHLQRGVSGQQQQQQQQGGQQHAAVPVWHPTSRQIDRHMLMSKNEPILFYAEVPLYESELDDNGVCQLTVKVRVMPRCWLVLLRFWLRVDGCLVRLWEVRHFCRLDTAQPIIIREVKHSEGTLQELAAAGAPTSVSSYEDAEAAAAVFSAIAPQCLKTFELHELPLPGCCSNGSGGGGGSGSCIADPHAAADAVVATGGQ